MLKPRKKLKKRQIKEDKFVTAYFKAVDWLQQNTRLVLYGVGGVFAIIIIATLIIRSGRAAEDRAALEVARAQVEMSQGNYDQAIAILETVVERYGGTSSARMALMQLAETYYEQGEFDLALRYFDQYLKKHGGYDPLLSAAATAGKAACFQAKGEHEEAARLFLAAVAKAPKGFNAAEYLLNAAYSYEQLGRFEDAKRLCQRIIDEYPKSSARSDAEMLLARVTVVQEKVAS